MRREKGGSIPSSSVKENRKAQKCFKSRRKFVLISSSHILIFYPYFKATRLFPFPNLLLYIFNVVLNVKCTNQGRGSKLKMTFGTE